MIYLNIIVSLQILFVFGILFFKNKNILNKLLAVIILIPGFNFISNALNISELLPSSSFGILFFVTVTSALFFAPLVFYYVHLMCAKNLKKWFFLYGITALIVLYATYTAFGFFTLTEIEKSIYIQNLKNENFPQGVLLINLLFIIMQQVYFTVAAIKVYQFKKELSNVFSSHSNVKIEFTQRFITVIWLLNLITLVLYATIPMYLVEFVVLPFVLFFINSFLVYYAFEYQVIFKDNTYTIFLKDIKLMAKLDSVKEKESIENDYKDTIVAFIKTNKPYLEKEYTVFDLAKEVKLPQRIVSDTINQKIGKSFSELINDFRVEDSKLLLIQNSEELTIDAIAEMSGFKSRSTFYRAFKERTNLTPMQYINNLKSVS